MDALIRPATSEDLGTINEIYNTYIVGSHVSFDAEPWSSDERAEWWTESEGRVLVAERSGAVVGAAYFGPWRRKEAYRRSVETTVVLAPAATGSGIGSALLAALIDRLRAAGYHRAYSIVALPNDASVAVHRKLGYRDVGVLDEVGHKLGHAWSTLLLECRLDGVR